MGWLQKHPRYDASCLHTIVRSHSCQEQWHILCPATNAHSLTQHSHHQVNTSENCCDLHTSDTHHVLSQRHQARPLQSTGEADMTQTPLCTHTNCLLTHTKPHGRQAWTNAAGQEPLLTSLHTPTATGQEAAPAAASAAAVSAPLLVTTCRPGHCCCACQAAMLSTVLTPCVSVLEHRQLCPGPAPPAAPAQQLLMRPPCSWPRSPAGCWGAPPRSAPVSCCAGKKAGNDRQQQRRQHARCSRAHACCGTQGHSSAACLAQQQGRAQPSTHEESVSTTHE